LLVTGLMAFLLGAPSALSLAFFDNQDAVWSLGLILNGAFIAFGVIRYGTNRFRKQLVNCVEGDIKMGKGFNFVLSVLIPAQAIILIAWYFYQGITSTTQWWNPFVTFSLGSIIFQWSIGIILFLTLNKWLVSHTSIESDHEANRDEKTSHP
ncbi:MAG: hypothetical protein ACKVOH_04140, partial [Chlamydiales bacterium]